MRNITAFGAAAAAKPLQHTILITTPHGHEVSAQMDEDDFAIRHAKVVNHYSGVVRQLDGHTADILARALRAKHVYEQALSEARKVERTLQGFGPLASALGDSHPTLETYKKEAEHHKTIARDMFAQARTFHEHAMDAIDQLADQDKGHPH